MNLFTGGVFILFFNFCGTDGTKKPNCPAPKAIAGGTIYGCRPDFYEDLGVGIATTCFFRCKKRFLHQGPRKIVCDMNGGWNGVSSISRLPSCLDYPKGHLCDNIEDSCPKWKDMCGSSNQIVACITGTTGKNHTCYCIDDPKVDYLKDLYLSPPKCGHCKKTGLKCKEGEVWGCKKRNNISLDNCKCTPIKVHGRCERLKRIVVDKNSKEEFATPEERFTGIANCTTDVKRTLSCTFSCTKGFLLMGNSTLTCDMNGEIFGQIPSCASKDSCKNPPLSKGQKAECDGSNCIINCQRGYLRNYPTSAVYNCDTKEFRNKLKKHWVFFECKKIPTCNGILPNNKIEGAKFDSYSFLYLQLKCQPEFIKPDSKINRMFCEAQWEYNVTCVKKKMCAKPPEIEGGTFYGCRGNSFEDQRRGIISTCFVKCQKHLMHQFSRKIVCDHLEGTWKGEFGPYPQCIKKKKNNCLHHLKLHVCKNLSYMCTDNGQWTICEENFGNRKCFCQDQPSVDYTPKDLYINPPSCEWCEEALGPCKRDKRYSCSRKYDYEECKCVTKQVHQYCIDEKSKITKKFTNGVVNCTTLEESKTISCNFTCNVEYYREGPLNWTCDEYGNATQILTSCKEMKCYEIEKPPKLQYSCWKNSEYNVTCRYRCKDDPYFVIDGNEYNECNGVSWKHYQLPNCKMICPALKKTQSFTCELNKSAQSYTCKINCKHRYEIDGSSEITCSRQGKWSDKEPTCKLWKEGYCEKAEKTYCDKIYRSRCKGANMGKCTIERNKPHRIDCGCHIPNRCWSCPFRDLNQTKGVNCTVNQQTKLWTCLVQCFPDDQDREHLTKTFTCQRNFTWSIIDKCAGLWKQKPCEEAERNYCKEFHHDGAYCTVEKKSPYRIDCGRNHPERHWECPKAKFLEGADRNCEKNVFHSKYGDNTLECNFPCTPGDTERVNGSRSYTCYKDKWFGPEDRCFKCSGVKERSVGNCMKDKNPCKGTGSNTSICLSLHKERVFGKVQTCQCECHKLDFLPDPCSEMKCLSGTKPFCGSFLSLSFTFCQCGENNDGSRFPSMYDNVN